MWAQRSASMYNSPYTYKPPPPRIDYGFYFSSLYSLTCKFALKSKLLLISYMLLAFSNVVIIAMLATPLWFNLTFDPLEGTLGSEPVLRQLTIESGLFYMRRYRLDNLLFMDTFTGRDVLPKVLQAAQFFAVLGSCILVPCFGAALLLLYRKFASPTALFFLAAGVTLGAVSEILVVILTASMFGLSSCDPYGDGSCNYKDNLIWRMIPLYTQDIYRVAPHTTPYVTVNWAFFGTVIGAGVAIAAAACLWLESVSTYNKLSQIRYQQLRQARDPYEHDVNPYDGKKYMYQPPTRHGLNTYGMQPVVHGIRYDGSMVARPEEVRGYVPPQTLYQQPPSPRLTKGGPASVTSSTSGPFVSREIDL